VSQAQAESALALTKEQTSSLKTLTAVGYLEGTSFLLLLCIAMPLKYMMGIPEAVKYIGMAHGILFIAYIIILMGTANKVKMPLWAMPAGVIASVLPLGPFVFDYLLKKSLNKR
jgi:integral membrane protein